MTAAMGGRYYRGAMVSRHAILPPPHLHATFHIPATPAAVLLLRGVIQSTMGRCDRHCYGGLFVLAWLDPLDSGTPTLLTLAQIIGTCTTPVYLSINLYDEYMIIDKQFLIVILSIVLQGISTPS